MLPPLTSTLKRSSKGFQILKMSLVETARGTSFLQRKTSVLKEKLKDAYSKESLTKHPSFVSYTDEQGKGHEEEYLTSKLQLVVVKEEYNQGPANDRPPSYFQVTKLDIPPPPPFPVDSPPAKEGEGKREVCFTQDFTALENYLKKKLSVKSKLNGSSRDSFLEATKVFEWLQELPKGNNLEEFLGVYGIPVDHVDLTELRSKLKDAWKDQLDQVKDKKSKKSATEPGWKRQVEDLEDLARGDNLEKWIESLDVPYFKPLPETKREIRKYLSTHHSRQDAIEEEEPGTDLPDARVASSVPENAVQEREEKKVKFLEPQTPKWKILIERMRELKDADELDKWLDSLNVPNHVPRAKAKAEIRKFFMHETWQSYKGWQVINNTGYLVIFTISSKFMSENFF